MSSIAPETDYVAGLHYRYRPGSPSGPLLLLVHGRAGNYTLMWPFARSVGSDCTIIAPQAPYPDLEEGGFSWWNLRAEDRGNRAKAAVEEIFLPWLTAVEARLGLEPSARVACGFSQGGALLSLALQAAPELFDGVALLASFVIEARPATTLDGLSILIAHGEQDPVVPLTVAERGARFLSSCGASVALHRDPVGHKIGTTGMSALKVWLEDRLHGAPWPPK